MDLRETVRRCGLDERGQELRLVAGSCESGGEPSGSIQGGKFLGWLALLHEVGGWLVKSSSSTRIEETDHFR